MDDSGGRRWFGWETALGGLLLLLGIVVGLGQASSWTWEGLAGRSL